MEDKKELDFLLFPEENNLSDKLLSSISELLGRHNLFPKNIEATKLETDLTDGFTTYRIAKIIVDTLNWGKKIC